jgi:hypothetical protein
MQLGIYEVVGEEMIVLKFFIDHEWVSCTGPLNCFAKFPNLMYRVEIFRFMYSMCTSKTIHLEWLWRRVKNIFYYLCKLVFFYTLFSALEFWKIFRGGWEKNKTKILFSHYLLT